MAMMMTGTIIGDIRSATTSCFKAKLLRTSPSAASVPSTMDSMVVATPMIMLFFSDNIQRGELMKSSYQRSERPGSG